MLEREGQAQREGTNCEKPPKCGRCQTETEGSWVVVAEIVKEILLVQEVPIETIKLAIGSRRRDRRTLEG